MPPSPRPPKPKPSQSISAAEARGAARDKKTAAAGRKKAGGDFLRGLAKEQYKKTYGNEDQRAVQMQKQADAFKSMYGGKNAARGGEGRADTAAARTERGKVRKAATTPTSRASSVKTAAAKGTTSRAASASRAKRAESTRRAGRK